MSDTLIKVYWLDVKQEEYTYGMNKLQKALHHDLINLSNRMHENVKNLQITGHREINGKLRSEINRGRSISRID